MAKILKGTHQMSVCCTKRDPETHLPVSFVEKRVDGTYSETQDQTAATLFDTIDYLFAAEHVQIQKVFPEAYIIPVEISVYIEMNL